MFKKLAIPLVLSLFISVYFESSKNSGTSYFFEPHHEYNFLIIYISMVAGMFSFQAFLLLTSLDEKSEKVNILKLFRDTLEGTKLWMALLVSPIVFYNSLAYGIGEESLGIACIIAFQNGFFWITIFNAQAYKNIQTAKKAKKATNSTPIQIQENQL